jgi:signal transduction histidine kinase
MRHTRSRDQSRGALRNAGRGRRSAAPRRARRFLGSKRTQLGGPRSPHRRTRLRLRNWRLVPKLAAILLVPVVAIGLLADLRLQDEVNSVATLATVHREQELADQAAAVAVGLQAERDALVAFVANGRLATGLDQDARMRQVDAAVLAFKLAATSLDDLDPAVRQAVDAALADLNVLQTVRTTILSTRFPDSSVLLRYTTFDTELTQVSRAFAGAVSAPAAAPTAQALTALVDAQEQLAEQNAILLSAAGRHALAPGLAAELQAAQSRFDADQTTFGQVSSAADRQDFQNVVTGPAVDQRTQLIQQASLEDATGKPVTTSATEASQSGETTVGLVNRVAVDVDHELDGALAGLSAEASRTAWRDGMAVSAFVLLALLIMIVVARSLLKPLRVLRSSALEVANERLPAAIEHILSSKDPDGADHVVTPVPIDSDEEVGQVARAFDAVQHTAVRLAAEQAALRGSVNEMVVNLSQRTQNLVERQISLLDQLEQDEQDPDQLANLFSLDHMATRMRRNCENLLVLAGKPVVQRGAGAVPAVEIFGGAVSEVEQYARITVGPAPEVAVLGHTARDLMHLLSALLDNATDFSNPNTKVTVRSVTTRQGDLRIEIHDCGVGMTNEELALANERLADPPMLDLATSRRMGLHVVAVLAKRHAVSVTLRANQDIDGGMTAKVVVPGAVIVALPPETQLALPSGGEMQQESRRADTVAVNLFTPVAAVESSGPTSTNLLTGLENLRCRVSDPQWPMEEDGTSEGAAVRPIEPASPDVPTERLPIYNAILSEWFRTPEESADVPLPRPESTPAVGIPVASGEPADRTSEQSHAESAPTWSSPADAGWQAVAALRQAPEPEVTTAGLPKRVPKKHLLPGSAQEPVASQIRRPPPGRLAAFARGAQQGRHSLITPDLTTSQELQ